MVLGPELESTISDEKFGSLHQNHQWAMDLIVFHFLLRNDSSTLCNLKISLDNYNEGSSSSVKMSQGMYYPLHGLTMNNTTTSLPDSTLLFFFFFSFVK